MSDWKQIKIPDDPDWIEWHREIEINDKPHMLKVWEGMVGFSCSLTDERGNRSANYKISENVEDAKALALEWALKHEHQTSVGR